MCILGHNEKKKRCVGLTWQTTLCFRDRGTMKLEDAADTYVSAGNAFKIAKKWSNAGEAFVKAGEIHIRLQSRHEAATQYAEAANCYKKTSPQGQCFFFVFFLWRSDAWWCGFDPDNFLFPHRCDHLPVASHRHLHRHGELIKLSPAKLAVCSFRLSVQLVKDPFMKILPTSEMSLLFWVISCGLSLSCTVILEILVSKLTILAFHKLLIFITWSVSQYTLILEYLLVSY